MKMIEIDDDLYRYIAGKTQDIGESASDILRRMLNFYPEKITQPLINTQTNVLNTEQSSVENIISLFAAVSFTEQKKVIDRFMMALQILYQYNPQQFKVAADTLHGRTRQYFAFEAETLLRSGKQSKPKHITGTPYWVITNTNSERKRYMIEQIMLGMKFQPPMIEHICDKVLLKNITE